MSVLTTAAVLDQVYGHELDDPVTYPSGVAMLGRLRLAAHRGDVDRVAQEIAQLAEPLLNGETHLPDAAPCLAAACFASELYEINGDARLRDLVLDCANRFTWDGDVRVEDFFFAATLLGRATALSGERAFADQLFEGLLAADTLQASGLYWHCHASPWYWGRGNAFAALGVAEALSLVADHPARNQLVERNLVHLNTMRGYQDDSGLWHQVVDDPATYLEHSATTMAGYACARGVRGGWLPAGFGGVADAAWRGAANGISDNGELARVCVGTGPLKSREAYVTRPFSEGVDARGGAMALLFATEMLTPG